jgi:DNA-binding response OmpR family regulator
MKRILIVEDDNFIRDLYNRAFSKAGYEVSVAADGQEALDVVKNTNFDMILLDIMLPKVNGIDVLRAYKDPKSGVKDTPVFLITNLGQEDIIKEAFKLGADGYLLKAQLTPKNVVDEANGFFEQKAPQLLNTNSDTEAD